MNIHYIEEFVHLAETKNYLECAEDLYISQSSLSKHIQALEKDLGIQLFNRTTRTVTLTDSGKKFLPFARNIAAQLKEFSALVNDEKRKTINEIALASNQQITQYEIYPMLIQFKRLHPNVHLDIIIKSHDELKKALTDHEADLVWIGETQEEQLTNHERIPFKQEPVVVIVPDIPKFKDIDQFPIAKLLQYELLIQDNTSIEQRVFRAFCQQNHMTPKITSIPGGQSLVSTVQAIEGVGLLFQTPAEKFLTKGLRIIPIQNAPSVQAALIYRKDIAISPAAKSFVAYVKKKLNILRNKESGES